MAYRKQIMVSLLLFWFMPGIAPDNPQQLQLQHDKIIDLAEECNEITITIDLKNNSTDLDEWDLAINTVKDWRKALTQTLKEKTPNIEMNVKISGHCCYKNI